MIVEEFVSYNGFYAERKEHTYDNRFNETLLKAYRIINGEEVLDEVMMTEYTYDDYGSVVYERMIFKNRFSLETTRIFTYDE